jgi:alanyl-tRNA synthetase
MTHRIYYNDPTCSAFDAVVTRAFVYDGRPAALLDRTAFYPTSGGQPYDTGRLGAADVLETVDLENGEIAHVLSAPLGEGERVHGEIAWGRRFDHMQQHTGQHLLSAAFDRLFENWTMSFHMGADSSTIDLGDEASPDAIVRAELEANRVVWEDRPVSIRFVSAEEAAALPLRKEPAREGTLRLIDVADFDLSACGGTHVARTGAIGIIAVTGWERFRGGTRVAFVCGGRALRSFRTFRDTVTATIRSLSVLPEELPAAVDRMQAESRELRRTVKTFQEALASHEAVRLLGTAQAIAGVRVLVQALDGWDAVGLKAIASAATAGDRVVAALISTVPPIVAVVARSKAASVDAQAVLAELVRQFGGRGGGKADLAQGGGLTGTAEQIVAAARAAIEAQLGKQEEGDRS